MSDHTISGYSDYKNHEGYNDPTCEEAIKKIERDKAKVNKILKTIFNICELSGFEIRSRIILLDKKSGHIWR